MNDERGELACRRMRMNILTIPVLQEGDGPRNETFEIHCLVCEKQPRGVQTPNTHSRHFFSYSSFRSQRKLNPLLDTVEIYRVF